MLPHKTPRAENALHHVRTYEGIPPKFARAKRVVVPSAMTVLCLQSDRKYCHLGRLSHEVGWKYKEVIKTFEAKRKVRAFVRAKKQERKRVSREILAVCVVFIR